MRGSEQAPYVFLKIQPTAPSLHTSWTLPKIAWLGIIMETIMGKEKRHLTHFETFAVLSMEGVLPFSTTFHLHSQNKSQNFDFTDFLCINSFCQKFFYNVLWPYRLKQRELAGVKHSIIWCCLPGCRPLSILAAYARVPCEVQSTCLNEYMLYKQHK